LDILNTGGTREGLGWGTREGCPYAVDDHDSMDVVGHNHECIHTNMREPFGDCMPLTGHDLTECIQYQFPICNVPE
jgi:hypothetical protein